MSCPMSSQVAVVGCASGHICVVGLVQPTIPVLLAQKRLYRSPVTTIRLYQLLPHTHIVNLLNLFTCRSDQRGVFLAIVSLDGSVFVCSALFSQGIRVIGHTGKLFDTIRQTDQFLAQNKSIIHCTLHACIYTVQNE